jgi:hypothetical protein
MINEKREERTQPIIGEEGRRAGQHFTRGLFRAGMGLALLPISTLPPEPQEHFRAAGREFAHGFAKLVHQLAHGLDEIVETAQTAAKE